MKSGFKDPIAPKKKKEGKYPFDFKNPPYDERSSCFIRAGTDHGVGHKQPVGSLKPSKASPIPYGHVNTMRIDET